MKFKIKHFIIILLIVYMIYITPSFYRWYKFSIQQLADFDYLKRYDEKEDRTEIKDEYKKKLYDNVKSYDKKTTMKKCLKDNGIPFISWQPRFSWNGEKELYELNYDIIYGTEDQINKVLVVVFDKYKYFVKYYEKDIAVKDIKLIDIRDYEN